MIKYIQGDATSPIGKGNKVIIHIVNSIGKWGKGFVLSLSAKWKEPEAKYREWYRDRTNNDFDLGAVQFVQVESNIWVANMVGQYGIYGSRDNPPIRYDAVRECLKKVCQFAKEHEATIHAGRFGAGLSGGKWVEIEKIINDELIKKDIGVTIYDLRAL